MRLAHEELAAIHDAVHSADADAQVYLFGSRVDDNAKGGDIDLLVLSKKIHFDRARGYARVGSGSLSFWVENVSHCRHRA